MSRKERHRRRCQESDSRSASSAAVAALLPLVWLLARAAVTQAAPACALSALSDDAQSDAKSRLGPQFSSPTAPGSLDDLRQANPTNSNDEGGLRQMPDNEQPLLHTIPGAAARLSLSESSIRRLIRSGEFRAVKVLGRTLVPETELQRLACPTAEVPSTSAAVEGRRPRRSQSRASIASKSNNGPQ